LIKFFGGVGCLTSNKQLDYDEDPDNDVYPGIFIRNIYHCGVGLVA